jgi:hypothetical protein
MVNPSKPSDNALSEQETVQRADAALKRMLNTPPKPHSEMKIGKRTSKTKQKKRSSKASD